MSKNPDPTKMSPQEREEHLDRSPEAIAGRTKLAEEVQRAKRNRSKEAERAADRTAARHPVKPLGGVLGETLHEFRKLPKLTEEEAAGREKAWRDEYEAQQSAAAREDRAKLWRQKCPKRFLEPFDFAKVHADLDEEARGHLRTVLEWQFSDRGLYILGGSGHSKTRAVYAMLSRLYVEDGRKVHFMDGVRFANEAAKAWRDVETTEAWLESLTKPAILFLDDLAKKWTPSTEEAAFTVLDRRGAAMKPTHITLNYAGKDLREISSDQSVIEPFLRRVGDYCEIIPV